MDNKPRMCPHCRAFIDAKATVCEYCDGKIGPPSWKRPDPGMALGGFISQAHFTTFIILLINFALFIATMVMTSKMQGGSISLFGGIDGQNPLLVRSQGPFRDPGAGGVVATHYCRFSTRRSAALHDE